MRDFLRRPRTQVTSALLVLSSGALIATMPLLGKVLPGVYVVLLALLLGAGAVQAGAAHVTRTDLRAYQRQAREQLQSVARQVVRKAIDSHCRSDPIAQALETDLPWFVRIREGEGERRTLVQADCEDPEMRSHIPSSVSPRRSRIIQLDVNLDWFPGVTSDMYAACASQEPTGGVVEFFYALPSSVGERDGRVIGDLVANSLSQDTLIAYLAVRLRQ
jgi:hypothetical protein